MLCSFGAIRIFGKGIFQLKITKSMAAPVRASSSIVLDEYFQLDDTTCPVMWKPV